MPQPTRHAELTVDTRVTLVDIAGFPEQLDINAPAHFTPRSLSITTATSTVGTIEDLYVAVGESVDGGYQRVWSNAEDGPDGQHVEDLPSWLRTLVLSFRPDVLTLLNP